MSVSSDIPGDVSKSATVWFSSRTCSCSSAREREDAEGGGSRSTPKEISDAGAAFEREAEETSAETSRAFPERERSAEPRERSAERSLSASMRPTSPATVSLSAATSLAICATSRDAPSSPSAAEDDASRSSNSSWSKSAAVSAYARSAVSAASSAAVRLLSARRVERRPAIRAIGCFSFENSYRNGGGRSTDAGAAKGRRTNALRAAYDGTGGGPPRFAYALFRAVAKRSAAPPVMSCAW